jgi:hypothetical protein
MDDIAAQRWSSDLGFSSAWGRTDFMVLSKLLLQLHLQKSEEHGIAQSLCSARLN